MRLVILRPSFWQALKGAEAGQDDESQGEKKDQNTSASLGSFVGGLNNKHLQLAELSHQGAGKQGMKS